MTRWRIGKRKDKHKARRSLSCHLTFMGLEKVTEGQGRKDQCDETWNK